MKKHQKMICLILTAVLMAMAFAGCAKTEQPDPVEEETPPAVSQVIKIASLNGPTGIGMVQMLDQTDKYEVTLYQSPEEVSGKVVSGEVDIAAVPANMAAILYNKTEGQVVALSAITKGMLYVVQNGGEKIASISDLAGKEIIAAGKGSTPEFILNELLSNAGVDPASVSVKWMANHADVSSTLLAGENTIAMLPEPFVTVSQQKEDQVSVALDLNQEWLSATGQELTMSVLLAQKSFATERAEDLAIFLSDYQASVDYVNEETAGAAQLVAEHGILPSAAVAEKAIPRCNIMFDQEGTESRTMLENLYAVLFALDPKSIGGKLPDEAFYD